MSTEKDAFNQLDLAGQLTQCEVENGMSVAKAKEGVRDTHTQKEPP